MFGTSGIRGEVGDEVTCELALSVGRAVASEGYGRVVVGRDSRESGELLEDALVAGVRECGSDVVRVGTATTPTVARSVRHFDADAGVVITASHNPPKDNGFKLWNPSGQAFDGSQRDAVSRRIAEEAYELQRWSALGAESSSPDARARHAEALRETTDLEDPPSVVVDAGNGPGGVTADVLYELGCEVTTLNAQEDGRFPGRPSEPNAETLGSLMATVGRTDADLGVAHDGDADRMMAVDADGEFVPKDALLALFARDAAGEGERVAAPVDTSMAVDDALAEVGASVTRTRVGDVHVAERATADGVVFGGEPSGAWIWPGETLCPDGPLAACRLVELVAERGPLRTLVDGIPAYPIRRDSVEVEDKASVMDAVRRLVAERYEEIDAIDGVRVDCDDGWFLLRASGTQPLVRVTAEARGEERARELFEAASGLVGEARAVEK